MEIGRGNGVVLQKDILNYFDISVCVCVCMRRFKAGSRWL